MKKGKEDEKQRKIEGEKKRKNAKKNKNYKHLNLLFPKKVFSYTGDWVTIGVLRNPLTSRPLT